MKIGDKMSIPVSVFALEEGIGNVEVYYTFKGKTQTKNLTMKKGDKETSGQGDILLPEPFKVEL